MGLGVPTTALAEQFSLPGARKSCRGRSNLPCKVPNPSHANSILPPSTDTNTGTLTSSHGWRKWKKEGGTLLPTHTYTHPTSGNRGGVNNGAGSAANSVQGRVSNPLFPFPFAIWCNYSFWLKSTRSVTPLLNALLKSLGTQPRCSPDSPGIGNHFNAKNKSLLSLVTPSVLAQPLLHPPKEKGREFKRAVWYHPWASGFMLEVEPARGFKKFGGFL